MPICNELERRLRPLPSTVSLQHQPICGQDRWVLRFYLRWEADQPPSLLPILFLLRPLFWWFDVFVYNHVINSCILSSLIIFGWLRLPLSRLGIIHASMDYALADPSVGCIYCHRFYLIFSLLPLLDYLPPRYQMVYLSLPHYQLLWLRYLRWIRQAG